MSSVIAYIYLAFRISMTVIRENRLRLILMFHLDSVYQHQPVYNMTCTDENNECPDEIRTIQLIFRFSEN